MSSTPLIQEARPRGRPRLGPEHRERVIEAALSLLAAHGSEGLQARTLARESGLSVGSLYKLVGDVDDIAREANLRTCRELYDLQIETLRQVEGEDITGQVMALAHCYLDFVQANARRWEAVVTYRHRAGPPPDWYLEVEEGMFSLLEERLGQLPGAADPHARWQAARGLWAAVHGIAAVALPASVQPDPVADAIAQIDLVVRSVVRELARPA